MAATFPLILCFEKQRLVKEFERAVSELHRTQSALGVGGSQRWTSDFENRLPRASGGSAWRAKS